MAQYDLTSLSADAHDRQHFLIEANKVLSEAIEYEVRLAELLRLMVPRLADWCIINLVTEQQTIEAVAWVHRDQEKSAVVGELCQRYPIDPHSTTGTPQVIRSGQAEWHPIITEAMLIDMIPDRQVRNMWQAIGYHSIMIVPLVQRGMTIGAFTLVIATEERHYRPDDVTFAEELAQRAAVAIENARLYRDMQAAVQSRDAFLLTASHELKTPLTALLGQAQLLQRRMALAETTSERDQRTIQVIVDQAQRLNKLISSLLDVSRLSQGQLAMSYVHVDLSLLIQQVVKDFQLRVEQHTIICSVPEHALLINGDALRLEQVFQNLIQNAIKYSPQGSTISVQAEQRNDRAVIIVNDQGIGIPESAISNLFQRFYQVNHSVAQSISGIGIGLYVVHEIITIHGGTVMVESSEGQGSSFTVTIPMLELTQELPA